MALRSRDGVLMRVICIDPGKRIGWALASGGRITECGTVGDVRDLPDAAFAVTEFPRVYASPGKWRGDPQHVVMVAAVAGEVRARYGREHVVEIEPRVWGGTADKALKRRRTESMLREGEPRGRSEHAWDALGMACWLLGRRLY